MIRDDINKSGERAVSNLWEQFLADCELALNRQKLFSKSWTAEEIIQNYTHAVSGELSQFVQIKMLLDDILQETSDEILNFTKITFKSLLLQAKKDSENVIKETGSRKMDGY